MAHGVPISAGAAEGDCGQAAPFILDIGFSSTHRIAQFWGLDAARPEAAATADRVRSSGPPHPATETANGMVIDEDGRVLTSELVPPGSSREHANDDAGRTTHR